jgi:deoxyribose-phosphate aldolase
MQEAEKFAVDRCDEIDMVISADNSLQVIINVYIDEIASVKEEHVVTLILK